MVVVVVAVSLPSRHHGADRGTKSVQILTAGGPWLSIGVVSGPQLELISLRFAHRRTDHYDQHDKHGQQHQYTADRYGHHRTVTHSTSCFGKFWLSTRAHRGALWTAVLVLVVVVLVVVLPPLHLLLVGPLLLLLQLNGNEATDVLRPQPIPSSHRHSPNGGTNFLLGLRFGFCDDDQSSYGNRKHR